jgi:hypothetical protein
LRRKDRTPVHANAPGVLLSARQGDREYEGYIAGFREALEMHGWSERRNFRIGSKLRRKEEARIEGTTAMAEYKARQQALREKTARLRALRHAREMTSKELPN